MTLALGFKDIYNQISCLTSELISISLCNDQNFPNIVSFSNVIKGDTFIQTEISFTNNSDLSIVLKNVPYIDIYHEIDRSKAYNLKMVDGALIQMMYTFINNEITSHRLAFFPSPDLADFQNNSEIYDNDELYSEVIMKNLVTFPVRFDFNACDKLFVELHHPKSHLTLGQYANCRIPVSSPVTPYFFLDFILRNFYNTAHKKYCEEFTVFKDGFLPTIVNKENKVIHIKVA